MKLNRERRVNEVRGILNQHDLMNLLDDAPDDEYDFEARMIVDKLRKATGEEDVARIIQAVFVEQFDERQDDDAVRAAASQIWALGR
jgi:hypothetical protein